MMRGGIYMNEILKEKEQKNLWELSGIKINTLHCFPESASEIFEAQKESYLEQGYEIIDSFISRNPESRMCVVNLLVKPIKNILD